MTPCEANRDRMFAYLDGELRGSELSAFESHLKACETCQVAVAGRRSFLAELQSARPMDRAPEELRMRVEGILGKAPERRYAGRLQSRWGRAMASFARFRWASPQLAFALVLVVAVAGGTWVARSGAHPRSQFAATSLRAHQDRVRGILPVALHSTSSKEISAWFAGKVPFAVSLPELSDLPPQQQPYQIEGAGLVPYGNGQLGYVAYRVGNKPVSLLVASASEVSLAGRRQVHMKSLMIHYDAAGGYHIVTWAVPKKGVTYALVSDASEHANQSCIVCHAAPKDRDFMRGLLSQ